MRFSEKLKYYRKKNNLTQKSLSKILKVSDKTISSWENDRTFPDIIMLTKLSKTFNITMDELMIKKEDTGNENKIIKKYNKFIKYKKIFCFFNIIAILLSYFELTEVFDFHFPIIVIIILILSFISWIFIKLENIKIIDKKNIMFFIYISILNIILIYIGTNIIDLIDGKSELYIKGIFLGRLILIIMLGIISTFEKILIK